MKLSTMAVSFVFCLSLSVPDAVALEAKLDLDYSNTYGAIDLKKESIAFVEEQLKKDPKDYRYHYLLGVLYIPENIDMARKKFIDVVRILPNHFTSYMNMGYISQAIKANSEETIKCFMKAIECAPDNPVGYNTLATVYMSYGKAEDAYGILEKGIERISNDESLYYNQSIILISSYNGKPEQAKIIRNMERSLSLDKKDIYYLLLGTYYLRTGSNEKAKNIGSSGFVVA